MPQEAWSEKDERQYEHVKTSEKKRGRSDDRASEIAVRTVNKQRRKEGRARTKATSGTGSPRTRLENRSVEELRNRARELSVSGRSGMTKTELIAAIRNRQ